MRSDAFLPALATTLMVLAAGVSAGAPNVVMVVVDDLNDFATPLGGADDLLADPEIRARLTPNLDRLAALGATFTCAQTAHPADAASRAAVLTGVSGETSGLTSDVEGENGRGNEPARRTITLPQALKRAGYTVETTGNVESDHESDARAATGWDAVRPYEQDAATPHRVERPSWGRRPLPIGRLVPTRGRKDDLSIAAWEALTESLDDQLAAAWAAERIASGAAGEPPRFVAVGLSRPHLPWEVPGVFFDRFPLESIASPRVLADDRADLPPLGLAMGDHRDHARVLACDDDPDKAWRLTVQAYLASVSYADYAVGKIVDAVEAANTDDDPDNDWAVVLWSDSGWHLGEKEVWRKGAVWEEASRSNLMLYAPDVTTPGRRVDTPVDLLAVAPTVCALAGVEPPPSMQGRSVLPLLAEKGSQPAAVALTSFGRGGGDGFDAKKYGLRSLRFRLVHYQDGAQELYDHEKDPDEFFNLLHPDNAGKLGTFGLTAGQVDAVRRWHGGRLVGRLIKSHAKDVIVHGTVRLDAIDTDGRLVEGPAAEALTGLSLGDGEEFLAAVEVRDAADGPLGLAFGEGADGRYEFVLDPADAAARLVRHTASEATVVVELRDLKPLAAAKEPGDYRLVVHYAKATHSVELVVQDGLGIALARRSVRLDGPLPADSRFAAIGAAGRAVALLTPAAPFPGDFTGDGLVNAADSTTWRDQLGSEVPVGTGADGDFDGRVERDDRNVWLANYGLKAAEAKP